MKAKGNFFIIIVIFMIITLFISYLMLSNINKGNMNYPSENEILQSHGIKD